MSSEPLKSPRLPLLLAIQVGGIVAINIFAPAMPDIARSLETSAAAVQWTITVFLIGFVLGQFVYGPLSDRFGRRPVLFGGILVFLAANTACALAASIDLLLAARVLQGFGACCGSVLVRAMVRDLYETDRAIRIMSYLAIGAGVAAAVAPSLGSALVVFGWRANFWFLAAAAALPLIAAWRWLPETLPPERRRVGSGGAVWRDYATLLSSRRLLGYALLVGSVNAEFFTFFSASPFILIDALDVPPAFFGVLMLMATGGFLVGSLIVARLAGRVPIHRLLTVGSIVIFVTLSVTLALALAGVLNVAVVMVPMFLHGAAGGAVFPPALAVAVGAFPRMAGTASGLMGAFQMGSAALASFVTSLFVHDTQVPMATIMFVIAIGLAGLGMVRTPAGAGDENA